MGFSELIGIRHVTHGAGLVAVVLTRNEAGTISGQCLLAPLERPIIDGPTVASVLQTIELVVEALLATRRGARP